MNRRSFVSRCLGVVAAVFVALTSKAYPKWETVMDATQRYHKPQPCVYVTVRMPRTVAPYHSTVEGCDVLEYDRDGTERIVGTTCVWNRVGFGADGGALGLARYDMNGELELISVSATPVSHRDRWVVAHADA